MVGGLERDREQLILVPASQARRAASCCFGGKSCLVPCTAAVKALWCHLCKVTIPVALLSHPRGGSTADPLRQGLTEPQSPQAAPPSKGLTGKHGQEKVSRAPASTQMFLPGKGCSGHTGALQGMTCPPFFLPRHPLFPVWSRFPLSSLELYSSNCCPQDSWHRDAPVAPNQTETSEIPQHNTSLQARGNRATQHHSPTSAPQNCAQEIHPGHSGLYQFWFSCLLFQENKQLFKTLQLP